MLKGVDLQVGQLVCSTLGRDKGKVYLVIGLTDVNRVLVADGKVRRIENPKKKNIKHLQRIAATSEEIVNKISNQQISDSDIVKLIAGYLNK
ncbi:KOW domain-containing RNA-binding protein [Peptococcaceae bacterium 1198_IL3148]